MDIPPITDLFERKVNDSLWVLGDLGWKNAYLQLHFLRSHQISKFFYSARVISSGSQEV